jgi:hypothetical protein
MSDANDNEAVKPTVIDLDPDQVIDEEKRAEEAKKAGTRVASPRARALLPAALAALVIGAIGGGWLYRDYVSSYFPSNEMTAMRERLDMLGKTHEQIGAQMQSLERLAAQLAADIDALEATDQTDRAAINAVAGQAAALPSRLAGLESANAELRAVIDGLRAAPPSSGTGGVAAIPADLLARIDALEKDVASLKTEEPGRADAAALTQAMADLKAKAEAGTAFADEYGRIARMVPAAGGLDVLSRHAATGLPNAKSLATELAALRPSLPVPELPQPSAEPGILDRMLEALSDVITIRDLDAINWQIVADKAIAFADAGDLAQAVAAIDAIEEAKPAGLQQWRDRAAARIALEAALTSASESVARDLAARQ